MIRAALLTVFACALAMVVATNSLVALAKEQEVFLPPDCDVLKIVGNGFKLELSQFEDIKKDFKEVAEESSQIEGPRGSGSGASNGATNGANGNQAGDDEADDQRKPPVNEHLFEDTAKAELNKDYGLVGDDLMRWIGDRATQLLNRIQRYNEELADASGGNRIVLDVLLLNTLVDLDNLNKEQISALRWVKSKLQKLLTKNIHREAKYGEVLEYVTNLIDKNKLIELAVTGKNEPGRAWVTNAQAIKRVLTEQRFSEELSRLIVEYMGGRFSMMKRSVVYEINRQPKQLDDGLYYANARGRVPADFPFTAQDAISHGAYN